MASTRWPNMLPPETQPPCWERPKPCAESTERARVPSPFTTPPSPPVCTNVCPAELASVIHQPCCLVTQRRQPAHPPAGPPAGGCHAPPLPLQVCREGRGLKSWGAVWEGLGPRAALPADRPCPIPQHPVSGHCPGHPAPPGHLPPGHGGQRPAHGRAGTLLPGKALTPPRRRPLALPCCQALQILSGISRSVVSPGGHQQQHR